MGRGRFRLNSKVPKNLSLTVSRMEVVKVKRRTHLIGFTSSLRPEVSVWDVSKDDSVYKDSRVSKYIELPTVFYKIFLYNSQR